MIISAMPSELDFHKHGNEVHLAILAICMSAGDTCALLSVSLQHGLEVTAWRGVRMVDLLMGRTSTLLTVH